MSEIIKSKFHMISKLFVYQIASSLLGIFVLTPFANINDSYRGIVNIAAAVFATLFYFSLVAYAVIEDGQKDCISHNAGRLSGNKYSGFIYGTVSYLPTIIIVVINAIINLCTKDDALTGLKSILGILFTRVFLMGNYWGFDLGIILRDAGGNVISGKSLEAFSDNGLVFVVCLIFLPIVSGLSYMLAFNGKLHVDTKVKEKTRKSDKNDK